MQIVVMLQKNIYFPASSHFFVPKVFRSLHGSSSICSNVMCLFSLSCCNMPQLSLVTNIKAFFANIRSHQGSQCGNGLVHMENRPPLICHLYMHLLSCHKYLGDISMTSYLEAAKKKKNPIIAF